MRKMTIGHAAKMAKVGVETIRFYEREGLIDQPSKPVGGGYRVYPDDTVECIRFIRKAQELGFSLVETKELLSLRADPDSECADVRAQASVKLKEVDKKIARLKSIRSALKSLIADCPGQGAATGRCTILEALNPPETIGRQT
jgi:MerR family mercuric resistance operon transcriptional regulator